MNQSHISRNIHLAIQDFSKAFFNFATWKTLGYYEVKQRYQRSTLGPWWVTLSMLIFVIVIGGVFSKVFSVNHADYMPYFCSGYLVWIYISTCVNESTELFKNNSGFIKQINLPLNIYAFKFMTKNIIVFFHNFLVLFLVYGYYKFNPGLNSIYAIPGFILLSINLYWVSLLIGLICTRFRDLVPVINSCVQILFLVTPISWKRDLISNESICIKLNPLIYLIDVVRDPLMGSIPSVSTYLVVFGFTLIGILGTGIIFSFCKHRLTFWLD